MNWKEFFKPTKLNIIILIFLVVALSVSDFTVYCPECPTNIHGFPLNFYKIVGCSNTNVPECNPYSPRYNIPNFVIDIIIWYVVSLIIARLYNKITKK